MSFFSHLGAFLLLLKGMFTKPENWKMYWKELMNQCVDIGVGALPIVVIISLFLGAVTTVQTAYQLVSPLVPQATIAQIVRDSMILELSPTVVCIVLAGVVGSKIASELGNMRISEQIDAIEIMGINTKSYLLFPKILAALIVVPALIVISAVLGIWGGREAGSLTGIISYDIYDVGLRQNLNLYNIQFALYKSYTFAFIISSVPAYFGYFVKGGALEIGKASTRAVVTSCILILFADYALAALLL
ncbi:MlaE family ABC transporter permease [Hydrotalea sandarakina]|jgi:phospholipid/cholesterol/gamma-HCH transport system permease protein|uniref:Phospholipid/cholesterol/gamma-HCH transport system permease protein n=1 Tax=Hydrotalea sandarakina TaxID=1004304 RepID=A0A2W7SLA0_9BACT|nr:ABC transporter permease [Hydrotalea sandarakina]PZX63725.1 phospholipid/cholesterol/gamma-HCH transport system permease protein [Hydrotalea sandarakina]